MHRLIEKAKREKRHLLEPEVLSLLDSYGIQIPPHKVVHNEKEALEAAKSGANQEQKKAAQETIAKSQTQSTSASGDKTGDKSSTADGKEARNARLRAGKNSYR